jgi:hypothetical protein
MTGYATFQLAKALQAVQERDDDQKSIQRVAKWTMVLSNLCSGTVALGSRTPVDKTPAWATLEVITGGFATGQLLAGGAWQAHELRLLEDVPGVCNADGRWALNRYFLTDDGLERLQDWLRTGCFDIQVPEEGALLVVAWLLQNNYPEDARKILSELSDYFGQLRFYPVPTEQPRRFGKRVHVQTVPETLVGLQQISPRIHTPNRAIEGNKHQNDDDSGQQPVKPRSLLCCCMNEHDAQDCRQDCGND